MALLYSGQVQLSLFWSRKGKYWEEEGAIAQQRHPQLWPGIQGQSTIVECSTNQILVSSMPKGWPAWLTLREEGEYTKLPAGQTSVTIMVSLIVELSQVAGCLKPNAQSLIGPVSFASHPKLGCDPPFGNCWSKPSSNSWVCRNDLQKFAVRIHPRFKSQHLHKQKGPIFFFLQ